MERGLAESRAKAQALILAGRVVVEGKAGVKPGTLLDEGASITVTEPPPFVSRGGIKLEHALDQLQLDVRGKVVADIGASTGGFTDCLLQRGAAKVHAVDVGHGQLAWKLRQDPRVVVLEAPLLIEAGWTPLVDEVWVTVAPEAAVLKRLKERTGMSEEESLARVRSQLGSEERAKHANIVVNTDCTLDEVRARVKGLWQRLNP